MSNSLRLEQVLEYLTNNQEIYTRMLDNLHDERRHNSSSRFNYNTTLYMAIVNATTRTENILVDRFIQNRNMLSSLSPTELQWFTQTASTTTTTPNTTTAPESTTTTAAPESTTTTTITPPATPGGIGIANALNDRANEASQLPTVTTTLQNPVWGNGTVATTPSPLLYSLPMQTTNTTTYPLISALSFYINDTLLANTVVQEMDISNNVTFSEWSENDTHTVDASGISVPLECCPITFQEFSEGDSIVTINRCGHVFSERGLRVWLNRNNTCPLCRGVVDPSFNSIIQVDVSANIPIP